MERGNPNHPVFKTLPGQREEILQSLGFPDEKTLSDSLDQFEEWVQKQNHFTVKKFDRNYLESYLLTAKGSMEKAKKRLDKRCTLRRMMPEFFDNIDIDTGFVDYRKQYKHACMPVPTPDFYRVIVDRFENIDNSSDFLQYGRLQHVHAEYKTVNDFVRGYECILDLRNVTLTEVMSKFNPMVLQKIMVMLIEGYGATIKATHIISDSKFIDTIVGLIKQGLNEKMGKRIQIHASHETLTKFIPKECLPSDFGGTQKSVEELDELLFQQLSSETHKARMKVVNTYATDESKRLSSKFNEEYMGMPGSFKTLSVD